VTPRAKAAAAKLAKDPMLCTDDTCANLAVLDGKCIVHAPMVGNPPEAEAASEPPNEAAYFNGGSALALAAILLMTTGDVLANDGETTDEILGGMAAVTGMPLDTAAGLLLATTLLARAGELTPEVLQAAAEKYTQQASEEN
jgi:hypothetical protein